MEDCNPVYAFIRGTAVDVAVDRAVVEAGGVGYELICSSMTLKRLVQNEQVKLYTHLYLVI